LTDVNSEGREIKKPTQEWKCLFQPQKMQDINIFHP